MPISPVVAPALEQLPRVHQEGPRDGGRRHPAPAALVGQPRGGGGQDGEEGGVHVGSDSELAVLRLHVIRSGVVRQPQPAGGEKGGFRCALGGGWEIGKEGTASKKVLLLVLVGVDGMVRCMQSGK